MERGGGEDGEDGQQTCKVHEQERERREGREGSLSGEDNASPGLGTAWRSHNPRGGIGRVRNTRSHSQSWGTEHRTIRL